MTILNTYNHAKYRPTSSIKNISFKGNSEKIKDNEKKIDIESFFEKDYKNVYATEYVPVKYEKVFYIDAKPMILPSQKYIKYKSTLRDEELFDNCNDIKFYYGPSKYDNDDVPVDENLWLNYTKNNEKISCYPETIISPDEISFYEGIHNPINSIEKKMQQEIDEKYKAIARHKILQVPNTTKETVNDIFKSSTLLSNGRMKIDNKLCDLAVKLYQNSEQWSDTEKEIMQILKIPFYQKIYIDYSSRIYNTISYLLKDDCNNEEILYLLNKKYKNYNKLNLHSIFTKEEFESLVNTMNK